MLDAESWDDEAERSSNAAPIADTPRATHGEADPAFARDVALGLGSSPKRLPPKYFYDALGSQLFEAICRLPWYPITRVETRMLERHADEMIAPLAPLDALVELGCGSGAKLAIVARALAGKGPLDVHLVDVSARAIELSEDALAGLDHVTVTGHTMPYEAGLRRVAAEAKTRGRTLALFLGSNIGNFDPPAALALLAELCRALRPGDGLLLGVDLVRAEADLLAAYDDPLGVTAAFNKNVLVRINRELGAELPLDAFAHQARWNREASRVEMHLVARRPLAVAVPAASVVARFAAGESIWTESSYKYTPERAMDLGRRAGFSVVRQWVDPAASFATTLFTR